MCPHTYTYTRTHRLTSHEVPGIVYGWCLFQSFFLWREHNFLSEPILILTTHTHTQNHMHYLAYNTHTYTYTHPQAHPQAHSHKIKKEREDVWT
jgi:hypothetical protein